MVQLEDIQKAKKALKGVARCTPLDYSQTFSQLAGNAVYLKLENYKRRDRLKCEGLTTRLCLWNGRERAKGVVAASAGNHAQGVAFASQMAEIESTIVMPEGAPLAKVQATKHYGAHIVLYGETFDEAMDYAHRLQQKTGAAFVHAFDDEHVITGQGTIGLEIVEQLPDVEVIVCPSAVED